MPGIVLSPEDTRNKNPALLDLVAVTIRQMLKGGDLLLRKLNQRREIGSGGGEVAVSSGLAMGMRYH